MSFKRLEFRACQIGADAKAMGKIAKFLNAKIVVGPTDVQTFYGVLPLKGILFIKDAAKLAAHLKKMNGRTFPKISVGRFVTPHAFSVVAQDEDALKAFVQGYIKAKYSGSLSPFVVGGVNSNFATTGCNAGMPCDPLAYAGEKRAAAISRRAYVLPRQIAMYIARKLTGASLQDLGRQFGDRHHTLALHSINKFEAMRRSD